MTIAFQGYRDWAKQIFKNMRDLQSFEINNYGVTQCTWEISSVAKADVILYYGWSKIIPKEIYTKKICLILHPSPLPKYRGGSPLQHQIMNGEEMSAVTIFQATGEMDAGPIYSQTPFSLKGSLNQIFERIIDIGIQETIKILSNLEYNKTKPWIQDESQATLFKRRKPEQSELKPDIFYSCSAKGLSNFIRALDDPYPNAFIKCVDGKKLYIKKVDY